ncbi:hypothetical protein [Rhodococcus sp. B10]|uniref:hypothetical protein n=1 Tax=Rhodococcus sp. B10 TaxID=2695876 RepID=UPI001431E167|nr:hypothetical protein [Rhodococcus sp. B10]NIL77109.1 hypothetical protein [Rhodococcus sp. B10]
MGRVLATTDTTDLSFYPGWDGCFVEWRPATYIEQQRLIRANLAGLDDDTAEQMAIDLVKQRVIAGKVKIKGEGGEPELVDIETEDIDSMPSVIIDRIIADMTGQKYDADPLEKTEPEIASSADIDSTKPQATTSTTETPSSEE